MIRFKFTVPIEEETKVTVQINNHRYRAHVHKFVISNTTYYSIFDSNDPLKFTRQLYKECAEYFEPYTRNKVLAQFGYTYCGGESLPFFNNLKDLEIFLNYITSFYTEI